MITLLKLQDPKKARSLERRPESQKVEKEGISTKASLPKFGDINARS